MTSEPHPALSVPVYRAVLDVNLGHKTATFDELGMRAVREAWASCSAELDRQSAEIATLTDEVDRLNQSLSWEQHRSGRIGTHGPNCHLWGHQHYECLLRVFNALETHPND